MKKWRPSRFLLKKSHQQAVSPNDAALEALEKAMGSETKKKFAVRHEEGYDLETDELYVVWSKLKALSIEDSEKGDEKSVEPLQKDSMAKGRVKASGEEEKLEQRNIDKEQTSQKKVEKERKNTQKGIEPGSQILKDILTYPKPVIRKKTKKGTSDFPSHLSGEQLIKYLQEKEEKKQAAEEEKNLKTAA